MTTQELIKKLQEVDPEGNTHVNIGGAIIGVYKQIGYYDGGYSYYDENDVLVYTRQGFKINIETESIYNIINDCDGDEDEIKKRVRLTDGNWKPYEKYMADAREREERSLKEWSEKILSWFPKDGYAICKNGNGKVYEKDGTIIKGSLEQGYMHVFYKMDLFKEEITENGCTLYTLK